MPIMNTVIAGGGSPAPAHYVEKSVDANGVLTQTNTFIDMTGVTDIGQGAMAFVYCQNTTQPIAVNMPDLEQITGENACKELFHGAQISSLSIPKLKKITGTYACHNMFQSASGQAIINASLPSLEIIGGNNSGASLFNSVSTMQSLSCEKLVAITGSNGANSLCRSCSQLVTVNIPSLRDITSSNGGLESGFSLCYVLQSLSFPALKNLGSSTGQFKNMCQGISNIVIHFPSNMQTAVEALQGYSTTTPFGASAGTVLFDLPATVILTGANSQAYERSPKDDTATALAWRKQDTGTSPNLVIDWTPYYTSGTTDPAVSDTIYSDAACTTAITTISSIA